MVKPSLDDFPSRDELLKTNQKQTGKIPAIKFLKKFNKRHGNTFEVVKGQSGKNPEMDWILKYHGRRIPMHEVAMICAFLYWNEDSIWPRPKHEGGEKFRAFIDTSMRMGFPTKELIKRTKLDKYWSKNS